MQGQPSPGLRPLTLGILGAVAMLGPFATDTYTPALPVIAQEFPDATVPVGMTLSAATLGMCLGQLLLGALSDMYGRKIIILGGGVVMAAAAAVAAAAQSSGLLVLMCFIMGFAISGGLAGGRAVVADLVSGEHATRPFALLAMMLSIGPIIGPIAGALLLDAAGWRSIFIGVAIFATACVLLVSACVPESLPREQRHSELRQVIRNYRLVLKNRSFLSNGLVLWAGFGVMFAYIASASFIIQDNLKLPPIAFALSFAINGLGLIVTSLLTAKIAHRVNPRKILLFGSALQLASVAALIALVLTNSTGAIPVLLVLFVMGIVMGFIFGPATSLAMIEVRFAAGAASALIGSLQFAFASVAAILVAVVSPNALIALTITSAGGVVLVVIALVLGAQHSVRTR